MMSSALKELGQEQASDEPINVLLIDDEADTLLPRLKQRLPANRFVFVKESDAAQAEHAIDHHKPDLILLDLHFPGDDKFGDRRTSGGTLLPKLRHRYPELPVIIFTTRLDDHDRPLEVFERRPHGYFAKSVLDDNENWPSALAQAMHGAIETARFEQMPSDDEIGFLVGQTQSMREVAALIRAAARSRLNVLVYGETGTGKQRTAEAIHRLSGRPGRFEQLNCSGVDEQTLEAKLFGHERGAYTGAMSAREGLFELADRGTLFLDELQRMPMALQDKLMLVVEQGKCRRMGALSDRMVDVRLVAATNHNLSDLVADNLLREDLAHRIASGLLIELPPLRERLVDIPIMFEHFVSRANAVNDRHVLPVLRSETLRVLETHSWPGNVRELETTINRAVVMTTSNVLLPEDIHLTPISRAPKPDLAPVAGSTLIGESNDTHATPAASNSRLIDLLCTQLQSLPLEQRYEFLVRQGKELRAGVLIEFIGRLRQRKGKTIGHKELAAALDPCNDGERDFRKIRKFVSACGVKLGIIDCNQ